MAQGVHLGSEEVVEACGWTFWVPGLQLMGGDCCYQPVLQREEWPMKPLGKSTLKAQLPCKAHCPLWKTLVS